jgi:hypothetical protein
LSQLPLQKIEVLRTLLLFPFSSSAKSKIEIMPPGGGGRSKWDQEGPEEAWLTKMFDDGVFNDDTKVSKVKEHPSWDMLSKGWQYDTINNQLKRMRTRMKHKDESQSRKLK